MRRFLLGNLSSSRLRSIRLCALWPGQKARSALANLKRFKQSIPSGDAKKVRLYADFACLVVFLSRPEGMACTNLQPHGGGLESRDAGLSFPA